MKIRWVMVAALLCVPGCKCGGDKQATTDAAAPLVSSAPATSASAAPARPRRATNPAPKPQELTFTTSDGVSIVGSYWSGGDQKAPALLLIHRAAGSRAEWTPLIERLFPPKVPMNVLAIDLRGHGASVEAKGLAKGKKLAWNELKEADFAAMEKDLEAAIAQLNKRAGGAPSAWLLAGSDLGATLATMAARQTGEGLRGVALVSPGASLRGLDIYKPFGKIMSLPNLIITAGGDNVSNESAAALSQMSKGSRFLRLNGSMHGAEYLGGEHPVVWDELADWVEERLAPPDAPPAGSAPAR